MIISICVVAECCGFNKLHVFRGLEKCREYLEQDGIL